ncbi:hypothetical protein [Phocaeicola sartorii]|uniref:hypothetical protein n=1 Tax=Phocaeicola sartorii TaxID=671267 RepID=UPI0013631E3D|nr:hypothetical protein [Phocaeicola sartorii]
MAKIVFSYILMWLISLFCAGGLVWQKGGGYNPSCNVLKKWRNAVWEEFGIY